MLVSTGYIVLMSSEILLWAEIKKRYKRWNVLYQILTKLRNCWQVWASTNHTPWRQRTGNLGLQSCKGVCFFKVEKPYSQGIVTVSTDCALRVISVVQGPSHAASAATTVDQACPLQVGFDVYSYCIKQSSPQLLVYHLIEIRVS